MIWGTPIFWETFNGLQQNPWSLEHITFSKPRVGWADVSLTPTHALEKSVHLESKDIQWIGYCGYCLKKGAKGLPPGKPTYLLNMAIEMIDLPIYPWEKKGDMFDFSYVTVLYQKVNPHAPMVFLRFSYGHP